MYSTIFKNSALLLLLILPAHAWADASLYRCSNDSKHIFQDSPCSGPGAKQSLLTFRTADTGVTSYTAPQASNELASTYSSIVKHGNSFQDNSALVEYDIQEIRRLNQKINQQRHCQAWRETLLRFTSNDSGHPWVLRQRVRLQKLIDESCS